MNSYIKKLQSKDEGKRKQILVVSLVVSMTIVGSVWMYSLSDRFSSKNKEAKSLAEADSTIKPFKLFANSISSAYHNITASVGNISKPKANDQPEEKQIDLIPVEYPNAQ